MDDLVGLIMITPKNDGCNKQTLRIVKIDDFVTDRMDFFRNFTIRNQ